MRATPRGGNAVYHYTDTAVLSLGIAEAPIEVTSDEFDAQLTQTLDRVGLRPGMLEALAGIRSRRWWPEDVSFADAAAKAGRSALENSGINPSEIGLLIDTSVCRDHLEPSAAVDVHHQLGLSTACLNFDLANACLGFVNGMQLAAISGVNGPFSDEDIARVRALALAARAEQAKPVRPPRRPRAAARTAADAAAPATAAPPAKTAARKSRAKAPAAGT